MATIYDIAKIAGVSISTVSKALNNYSGINQETKNRILAIAKENGFQPNAMARSLATKQSHIIGFFLNDAINSGLLHPFFQRVIQGSKRIIGNSGYDILFFSSTKFTEDRFENDYLARAIQRQVDGILMMGMDRNDIGAREIAQSQIPSMFIDLDFPGLRSGYVQSNNFEAARQVAHYLMSLGHVKIALIGDQYHSKPGDDRSSGFVQGLLDHGLKLQLEWKTEGDFTYEGGYTAMMELLQNINRPTAVFALSDEMAMGAIAAIQNVHLRIPEDISVVGFDDILVASSQNPPLTTIKQDMEVMGERAAEELLHMIKDKTYAPQVITVDTTLIKRGTCTSPN